MTVVVVTEVACNPVTSLVPCLRVQMCAQLLYLLVPALYRVCVCKHVRNLCTSLYHLGTVSACANACATYVLPCTSLVPYLRVQICAQLMYLLVPPWYRVCVCKCVCNLCTSLYLLCTVSACANMCATSVPPCTCFVPCLRVQICAQLMNIVSV